MAHYVGVDLGATNLRAVVGDDRAEIRSRAETPTPRGSGIAITEAVLRVVREACSAAGVDPTDVAAAGIGSIGPLDLAEGVIDGPANIPDVGRVPLVGPLSELLDTDRVFLHNDTIAGVIGERFHSDRNPDDMVYVTISSGLGAGVCVDGHVLSGWDGNAGEVGHMVVDPDGAMTCGCGRDGHWEAYCSGNNIPEYARYLAETTDGLPTELALDSPDFSAVDVFDAHGDDPLADRVVERVADWNVVGFTNLANAYAPLVVRVGGAVALNNPEIVLDPVRERLEDTTFVNVPDVRLTDMGDDVVVKGALASAITDGTGERTA
ncbi:ROK family protein [Halobaculum sp. CBA1158]|uniref:ROK family protein n=1 Tax=Halobaculum sp. CBA1158 TaxID=2904243 RepID=UPI001F1ABE74|nr:ROK family protein [Halobaculum sp. CBA1158]UIP00640.1 ROK family protein [Halobaculum sp. CBA1158]